MKPIITDDKIYKLINKIGLVDNDVLDTALKTAQQRKKDFVTFLIEQSLIKPKEIGQLIANDLHVKYVDLSKEKIDNEVLRLLPEIVARKQKMIIFKRDEAGVKVAMANPFDYSMVKALEKKVGESVIPYFSTEFEIKNSFGLYRRSIQQEYAATIQKHAIAIIKNSKISLGNCCKKL